MVNTQIAYILHKRAFRETSSILDVLTRDFGRISLMARGVRGARSKSAGNLMLFTPLLISWQGKGSLPNVRSVERADLPCPVLKNRSLLSAMYINELVMYLLHKDDVHEEIFEQYHQCLYSLEDQHALEISLRRFELKLLELLGFGLNFHTEADSGETISDGQTYLYHLDHGPVACTSGKQLELPEISGNCLNLLACDAYDTLAENPTHLLELKRLMRFVINHHLGDKKLKSRELFKPVA